MITVHLYKAQPTGDQIVEDLKIVVDRDLPNFQQRRDDHLETALNRYKTHYRTDAKSLAQLLHKTLPGGTFDQLLCEMLQIKSSHFRVSFGEKE